MPARGHDAWAALEGRERPAEKLYSRHCLYFTMPRFDYGRPFYADDSRRRLQTSHTTRHAFAEKYRAAARRVIDELAEGL